MNGQTQDEQAVLVAKLARLIEERGWSQEELVRRTGLHRHTVRAIVQGQVKRKLRSDTIARCARALHLTVQELRDRPLQNLMPRRPGGTSEPGTTWLYDQATQPELLRWIERNPERAKGLSRDEIDELLSLQGTGGPLTRFGVEHYVELLERKRVLIEQIHAIAGTDYLQLLEQFVALLYDKIQAYPERGKEHKDQTESS
jgi:transcriptional regulator with XRE-family HTH domain